MPGNVYVFNLYSEQVNNLTVSGCPAGSIGGYATGSGAAPYTPASLAVPRAQYPSGSAAFVLGGNPVQVSGIRSAASPRSTSPRRAAARWA